MTTFLSIRREAKVTHACPPPCRASNFVTLRPLAVCTELAGAAVNVEFGSDIRSPRYFEKLQRVATWDDGVVRSRPYEKRRHARVCARQPRLVGCDCLPKSHCRRQSFPPRPLRRRRRTEQVRECLGQRRRVGVTHERSHRVAQHRSVGAAAVCGLERVAKYREYRRYVPARRVAACHHARTVDREVPARAHLAHQPYRARAISDALWVGALAFSQGQQSRAAIPVGLRSDSLQHLRTLRGCIDNSASLLLQPAVVLHPLLLHDTACRYVFRAFTASFFVVVRAQMRRRGAVRRCVLDLNADHALRRRPRRRALARTSARSPAAAAEDDERSHAGRRSAWPNGC
eukprot:6199935-Pleurochrysis_carterae.AAC.3